MNLIKIVVAFEIYFVDYCDNEEIEKTYTYTINKLMF